jgi:hypothetical protein
MLMPSPRLGCRCDCFTTIPSEARGEDKSRILGHGEGACCPPTPNLHVLARSLVTKRRVPTPSAAPTETPSPLFPLPVAPDLFTNESTSNKGLGVPTATNKFLFVVP